MEASKGQRERRNGWMVSEKGKRDHEKRMRCNERRRQRNTGDRAQKIKRNGKEGRECGPSHMC